MGLDIYHYGKKKEEVFIAEISQQLHTPRKAKRLERKSTALFNRGNY
jgi:hypothetical protein